jgi:hypothetical protein
VYGLGASSCPEFGTEGNANAPRVEPLEKLIALEARFGRFEFGALKRGKDCGILLGRDSLVTHIDNAPFKGYAFNSKGM